MTYETEPEDDEAAGGANGIVFRRCSRERRERIAERRERVARRRRLSHPFPGRGGADRALLHCSDTWVYREHLRVARGVGHAGLVARDDDGGVKAGAVSGMHQEMRRAGAA